MQLISRFGKYQLRRILKNNEGSEQNTDIIY